MKQLQHKIGDAIFSEPEDLGPILYGKQWHSIVVHMYTTMMPISSISRGMHENIFSPGKYIYKQTHNHFCFICFPSATVCATTTLNIMCYRRIYGCNFGTPDSRIDILIDSCTHR